MALPSSTCRSRACSIVCLSIVLLIGACTSPASDDDALEEGQALELAEPPRRYSAEWLIDMPSMSTTPTPEPEAEASDAEAGDGAASDLASPTTSFLYREVVDDQTGTYLVESPNHLALQSPELVVLCAAVSRVPLDPFCASASRADGSPHVLSYPVQLIQGDWGPSAVYDLAGYREVSLVAESDPDNWTVAKATATGGFRIECFLVSGESSAAATGFEICFTDDDLHLVASVDLQNDLVFEIDLVSYERVAIFEDFETGFEDFIEERPALQDQLLDLYPEIPAPRPTPTPDPEATQ